MLDQVIGGVVSYQVSTPLDYALFALKVYDSDPLYHTSWSFCYQFLLLNLLHFAVSKF